VYPQSPDTNTPELPWLKAGTPKRSPAWGFCFGGASIRPAPRRRAMFDVGYFPPKTPQP